MAAVEPYRFEPERAPDENQAPDQGDDNEGAERLITVNWCTCGRCQIRETVRECIFCLEEPNRKTSLRKVYYESCTFCPFNVQSSKHQISMIKPSSSLKSPVRKRALP